METTNNVQENRDYKKKIRRKMYIIVLFIFIAVLTMGISVTVKTNKKIAELEQKVELNSVEIKEWKAEVMRITWFIYKTEELHTHNISLLLYLKDKDLSQEYYLKALLYRTSLGVEDADKFNKITKEHISEAKESRADYNYKYNIKKDKKGEEKDKEEEK